MAGNRLSTIADRYRILRNRYGDRVKGGALWICFLLIIVGSVTPKLGDWIEGIRFAGPALLLAVAIVLFEAITRDQQKIDDGTSLILARPTALLPFIHEAATKRHFSLTFVGYSSETLYGLLAEVFSEIPDRQRGTESVHIRVLIPDCTQPMTMPCLRDTLQDYPPYREIAKRRADEFCGKIRRAVEKLKRDGKIAEGIVEIRTHRLTPLVKVYLLNDDAVFWGLYPIEESVYQEPDESETPVLDLKGTRTPLMGAIAGRGKRDLETIRALSAWTESIWSSAARPMDKRQHG